MKNRYKGIGALIILAVLAGVVYYLMQPQYVSGGGGLEEVEESQLEYYQYTDAIKYGQAYQFSQYTAGVQHGTFSGTDIWYFWADFKIHHNEIVRLATELSGGSSSGYLELTCDWDRPCGNAYYNKDPWGSSQVLKLNELLNKAENGKKTEEFYTPNELPFGSLWKKEISYSEALKGHSRKMDLVVVQSTTGTFGWAGGYRNTRITVDTVLIYDDWYCDPGDPKVNRGDEWCFSFGVSLPGGAGRPFYCDEKTYECKDPCAGCSAETGRCIASYTQDKTMLRELLKTETSLCMSNQFSCTSVSDCGNYIKQAHGSSYDSESKIIRNKDDYDKFSYGVHCEKANPSDPLIKKFNSLTTYGDLGTCAEGAIMPSDCSNDETFGSASNYRYIDNKGNFRTAKGWGVDDGDCVLLECGAPNDCLDGVCNPKYLDEKQYIGSLVGYCSAPTITSECSKDSDCKAKCPSNTNPICMSVYTAQGNIGVCNCIDIPSPTLNCRTQTAYSSDDAYCMFTRWSSLPACKKYECSGDAASATCKQVAATCSKDSDCDVGDFDGYGKCINGCCKYGDVIPPKPKVEICDDGEDNDGDGLIDDNDPDCEVGTLGITGDEDWLVPLLVALFASALIGIVVYPRVSGDQSRKLGVSMIAMIITAVAVFFIVDAMDLQAGNPFKVFTPNLQDCSRVGGWIPGFDQAVCELGNVMEAIKWLLSSAAAIFAVFLAWGIIRNIRELNGAMKAFLLIIIGTTVFLLVGAIFWFAVIALVIIGFIWGISKRVPGVAQVGGMILKSKKARRKRTYWIGPHHARKKTSRRRKR